MGVAAPHSAAAERAVLGAMVLDPARIASVCDILQADDFYQGAHQELFALMVAMDSRGEPVELTSVAEAVARSGRAVEFGGLSYVAAISDEVPSSQNAAYYAHIVADRAVERRVLDTARTIIEEVNRGEHDTADLVRRAEAAVYAIGQQRQTGDWSLMGPVVEAEFERIQRLSASPGKVTGISTGLRDLDRILAGLHRTDLLILAARPAMGKTALALNIAAAVASAGHGVGMFSLEMSAGQLTTRMLVARARVSAGAVRTGKLDRATDWPALVEAAEAAYRLPIFIDDTPGLTISQLRSKARRLKSKHPGLALLVVDYIGLMSGDDKRASRQEQVAASSRGLKALAKELDVTVLALSQLNRAVEQRDPKIPQMSDLRESGAIEQDADVIMFIYRDEYYLKEASTRPGEADVIVAKQRNGATGTVPLAFQGEFTLFTDLARPSETAAADGYF